MRHNLLSLHAICSLCLAGAPVACSSESDGEGSEAGSFTVGGATSSGSAGSSGTGADGSEDGEASAGGDGDGDSSGGTNGDTASTTSTSSTDATGGDGDSDTSSTQSSAGDGDADSSTSGDGDSSGDGDGDGDISAEFIYISGGTFESAPLVEHMVPGFELMRTEVTVAQYQACVDAGECEASAPHDDCNVNFPERAQHPVNCVGWQHADAFCTWFGARLPTQWEWEWAARGRIAARDYPWGDTAPTCTVAVMSEGGEGCGVGTTWPVGSKPQGDSLDGVQDMAGNVWEWMSDYDQWDDWYAIRGGAWQNSQAMHFEAGYEAWSYDWEINLAYGMRCARDN